MSIVNKIVRTVRNTGNNVEEEKRILMIVIFVSYTVI
jgi:hypothetical protein